MIDKKDILKMAKHVFKKGGGYPDRRLMHAKRDWAIGLFIFTIVVIAGGVIAGNIFALYNDVALVEGDPGERIPTYNQNAADAALELYRERGVVHQGLQSEGVRVVEEVVVKEVVEVIVGEAEVEEVPALEVN